MNIFHWDKEGVGFMIQVNPKEALALIKSLSSQLLSENPNTDRAEFRSEKNEYFSIAVHEKILTLEEKELELDHIYGQIQRHARYGGEWALHGDNE